MNNLFKAKILAYSKDMFASAVASNINNFIDDFNIDIDMMLVQYKNIDKVDLDRFLDSFRRIDCQYVFNGGLYYRKELERLVSPYCKEMCISVVPKCLKMMEILLTLKRIMAILRLQL